MKRKRKAVTGIIKFTTVKDYLKEKKGMRSREDAVHKLIDDFDFVLETVIDEAKALAQEADRTTIMKPDVVAALEKHLRGKDLPWDETAKQVIKHKPAELGRISERIREWIREHEQPAGAGRPGAAA